MLGNLLDNACKWTHARVVVDSMETEHNRVVTVDDDGIGLPKDTRQAVLERGVRADERDSGSCLGLAIVRDLAKLYQATISLGDSALGGVRAILTLSKG